MTDDNDANALCKSCGLCCSGHLFAWVRLNAPELDPAQSLGLNVIRNDPRQRGFTQPCPMWNGVCTVYTSPDYPRSCGKYKCRLLRELIDENIHLEDALSVVKETMGLIHEIEPLLPASTAISFRERLVTHKENLEEIKGKEWGILEQNFLSKAEKLLDQYDNRFGVDDFIDYEK